MIWKRIKVADAQFRGLKVGAAGASKAAAAEAKSGRGDVVFDALCSMRIGGRLVRGLVRRVDGALCVRARGSRRLYEIPPKAVEMIRARSVREVGAPPQGMRRARIDRVMPKHVVAVEQWPWTETARTRGRAEREGWCDVILRFADGVSAPGEHRSRRARYLPRVGWHVWLYGGPVPLSGDVARQVLDHMKRYAPAERDAWEARVHEQQEAFAESLQCERFSR